jgi:PAS domain S-box-containing protein
LKDDAGNIIGVIEQFRDITEQRRMEGQVRESEERYRSLIDLGAKAGEAVVILQDVSGKEGVQTFVSEQWLGITGYSRKKLLGTRFFDLINKEGHSYPISKYKQKILTETISSMFEMQIIGKNGNIIDVELTSAPIVYKGKSANVIYLRDITHRKQIERKIRESEELYRGLFQNVPVAIQEYDFSQVKKYYDQLRAGGVHDFRKQFFVDNPDELINCEARLKLTSINKQAIYLFDVPDAERFMNDMIRTHKEHSGGDNGPRECHIGLAEGKKHFDYEELFQSCEGKWRLLHTWVSVAPGFEDSLSKVYLCFIDISARKKAENELVEYKDHLEDMVMKRTNELEISHAQLEEQISQRIEFTRALVHELKTPLTPMRAASELHA